MIDYPWPNFHTHPSTIRTTAWERRGDLLHEIETIRTYDADGNQTGFVMGPTGQTRPAVEK